MFLELAQSAFNGEADPLEAYVALKKAEQEVSDALKIVQPLAINEADKYPGKTINLSDATIEKRSAASRWDYSGVAAWSGAKEKLTYIEKIAQAGGGVDPDTAEEIGRAVKIEGKATIAVSLKKVEA